MRGLISLSNILDFASQKFLQREKWNTNPFYWTAALIFSRCRHDDRSVRRMADNLTSPNYGTIWWLKEDQMSFSLSTFRMTTAKSITCSRIPHDTIPRERIVHITKYHAMTCSSTPQNQSLVAILSFISHFHLEQSLPCGALRFVNISIVGGISMLGRRCHEAQLHSSLSTLPTLEVCKLHKVINYQFGRRIFVLREWWDLQTSTDNPLTPSDPTFGSILPPQIPKFQNSVSYTILQL